RDPAVSLAFGARPVTAVTMRLGNFGRHHFGRAFRLLQAQHRRLRLVKPLEHALAGRRAEPANVPTVDAHARSMSNWSQPLKGAPLSRAGSLTSGSSTA